LGKKKQKKKKKKVLSNSEFLSFSLETCSKGFEFGGWWPTLLLPTREETYLTWW